MFTPAHLPQPERPALELDHASASASSRITMSPIFSSCMVGSAGSDNQSSAIPLLPSFVFTLAATGTTLSISMFSSAE